MSKPSGQYMRIAGTGFTSAGLSVGSVILIQDSAANNGLYTINMISSDSIYEYAGLSGNSITNEENSASIEITQVSVGGNKLLCLGDEDTGIVKVWSYNNSTTSSGTIANAPSVGTSGWSNNAAKPLIHGSNVKYIFTPGQSAIRICDTNISNTSLIKHFSYIAKMNFSHRKGGMYAGYYEHGNTLTKPSTGGYINKPYNEKEAYGIDEDGAGTVAVDFHLRRSLGEISGSGYSSNQSDFCEIGERGWTDYTASEHKIYMQDSNDLAKIPLDGVIGLASYPKLSVDVVEHITATNDQTFGAAANWVELNIPGGNLVEHTTVANRAHVTTTTDNEAEGIQLPIANLDGAGNNYPLKVGSTYRVSVKLDSISGITTPFNIALGGVTSSSFTITSAETIYTKDFVITDTTSALQIYNTSASTSVFTVGEASVKELVEFKDERMLVRSINKEEVTMDVYRGYAGTTSATIDDEIYKYVVEYGCGFNFKVSATGTGGYKEATYEFAQSFIYDGNQESLLRTRENLQSASATNTLAIGEANNLCSLQINVYAFGPYNGRVTGGRIYIREKDSNEAWSLLVDIDLIKGCRTGIDTQFKAWSDISGTDDIPNGCFYVRDLISNNVQLDKYQDINNYYPEIRRNSIGYPGESYQASATGGERSWVGNVKLLQDIGTVERFGDRVMYSEFGKYDVFPDLNWFTASKGDAEDITALEYFGDRLLIFKNRTLHIWNVASSEPFNWMPERTVQFGGIENHYSVASTPYGVVWANRTGCYFYDGEQVTDLTENKIRDVQNSAYGSSYPPSWETFIKADDYTEKPMVMYAPKEKQIYILKDVTGGSSSNECYIYNFLTRSWVFNTSLFTSGVQYTNSFIDWNGNLVFAQDSHANPTSVTTLVEDDENKDYSTSELITNSGNYSFDQGTTQWVEYSPTTTMGTSPGLNTTDDRLEPTGTRSTTGAKEGVELPLANITTTNVGVGRYYTIKATIWSNSTMVDVPFFFEFYNASIPIGEITTTPLEYSATILATHATSPTDGNLRIYKKDSTVTNFSTGTDYGDVDWYISSVSLKDASFYLEEEDKFNPGDFIRAGNTRWYKVINVNPSDTSIIQVESGYFGTTAGNHSSGETDGDANTTISSSVAEFKQISDTSIATAKPSFITKDIDFDQPGVVKKVYAVYFTYKNSSSSVIENKISVAADGNTSFYTGTGQIISGQSIASASNSFTDNTQAGTISSGATSITMDGANTSIIVGQLVTDEAGAIPPNTKVKTVASAVANPQVFILDTPITSNITGGTTLTFKQIVRPALTGKFLASQSSWDIAKFTFDKPLQCQSLTLYFNDGQTAGSSEVANGLSINDITFEYRVINRRVR